MVCVVLLSLLQQRASADDVEHQLCAQGLSYVRIRQSHNLFGTGHGIRVVW